MGLPISDQEQEEVREMILTMDQRAIAESLLELASREKALFDGPIGEDADLRRITLWNLAVLCAAAEQADRMAKLVPVTPDP